MSEREAKVKSGRGRNRQEPADEPQNGYRTTEEGLRDLVQYVNGQIHQPDAPLQLEDIVGDLNGIIDDDLLASMEETFERAVFHRTTESHEVFMDRLVPNFHLVKKLRDLQKTKLRDAIARVVKLSIS